MTDRHRSISGKSDATADMPYPVRREMEHIQRILRGIIWAVGLLLGLRFAWLEFSGIDYGPLLGSEMANIIFRVVMTTYYVSWLAGTASDMEAQMRVYCKPPGRLRAVGEAIVAALVLSALFALMCWTSASFSKFALFLDAFLLANIVLWVILVKWTMPPVVNSSRHAFAASSNFIRLEQLRLVVDDYLWGSWQWWRFAAGAAILFIMNVFAFSRPAVQFFAHLASTPPDLIQSLTLVAFIGIIETWVWLKRLKRDFAVDTLERLGELYHIHPVEGSHSDMPQGAAVHSGRRRRRG